jgi:hypothetical protein
MGTGHSAPLQPQSSMMHFRVPAYLRLSVGVPAKGLSELGSNEFAQFSGVKWSVWKNFYLILAF